MRKHVKTKILSVFLVATVVSVGLLGYYFGALGAYIGDVTEVWVQPPFHEASYVVGVYNSTHYYAQNSSTGNYDYQSTNASYVINTARENLGTLASGATGSILVKKGTYAIANDITIGKKTQLIAEVGAKFDVTANLANGVIVIDGTTTVEAEWKVENLEIDLNSYNGNGIYSVHAGRTSSQGLLPALRNLYIHSVKTGYSCIDFLNFMNVDFSNLRLRTSGTGLKLGQDLTESAYFGNSIFNMVRVGVSATNAVGLNLSSASATYTPIFLTFNGFQVTGGNQDGTVGIVIRGPRECSWHKTYIEQVATGIDVSEAPGGQHSYDLEWFATTVRVASGRTAIKIGTDVYGMRFFGGQVSTSGTWLDYSSNAYNAGTKFYDVSFEGGGSMSIGGDKNIEFVDCYGYRTENVGTDTISASTSKIFTHGLAGTVDHVEIGWKDTGYGTWKWSANSTHITITVTNSGTYDFSWYAKYIP